MEQLMKKPLPKIPQDIEAAIAENRISSTDFENRNEILRSRDLQTEAGVHKFDDGSWLVSMYCTMPGITAEMINWWFWWHAQDDRRYQVWYPGAHHSIHYHKKNREYFQQAKKPEFQPNSQFPVESIGGAKMPLRIDFVRPEEFGFSLQDMSDNSIAAIVCGHVSAFGGLVPHTEMAHIFRQTEDGLFMFSRFWLGRTMNPLLRKIVMTEKMARDMAEHCCIEYRNLAEILPGLYEAYGR